MELYFEKGSLSEDEMRQGIKLGMKACTFFHFYVLQQRKYGVRRFMEFVVNNVPSPAEVEPRADISGKAVKAVLQALLHCLYSKQVLSHISVKLHSLK